MNPQTSVNNRLPAAFRLLGRTCAVLNGDRLFDMGCGRWPEYAQAWAEDRGVSYRGFDPHYYPKGYGSTSFDIKGADIIVCSNVLNVLTDNTIRHQLMADIASSTGKGQCAVFAIYKGKPSKSQLGWGIKQHMGELREYFPYVELRHGSLIYCDMMEEGLKMGRVKDEASEPLNKFEIKSLLLLLEDAAELLRTKQGVKYDNALQHLGKIERKLEAML